MALSRVSTRAGRFLAGALSGRGKLVEPNPHLWLSGPAPFLQPRGLRLPTPRFGLRLSRVALAVAFLTGPQFPPTEMFPQGVAHQSGPVSLSALRGWSAAYSSFLSSKI